MMKKIIILAIASTFAINVYADDIGKGFDETDKATTYVKCGLYADISNIYVNKTNAVPEQNAQQFRTLALKHWRNARVLLDSRESGDEEIIDFAVYVSSQESIAWDEHPEMNKPTKSDGNPATAAYMAANCGMLLEAAK